MKKAPVRPAITRRVVATVVASIFIVALIAGRINAIGPARLDQNTNLIKTLPNVYLIVDLDYDQHRMVVHQTVALANQSPDAWDQVVFNVPIAASPGAFHLDAVTATSTDGSTATLPPPLPEGETALRIHLNPPAQPGSVVRIVMDYSVDIPAALPSDQPPVGTTSWNDDLIQAGEWYPVLAPYQPGHGWRTWPYVPMGDPVIYELANVQLAVIAPPGVTVASGGALGQDREGRWQFEVQAARGIAFLASPNFAKASGEVNGIPIHSYFLHSNPLSGQAALQIAGESIVLYEELFGPYPYEDLTVVQNTFDGGMEYSSLVTVAHQYYPAYDQDPQAMPSLLHLLISHEVAHQWWYGAVGSDQVYEPWLDESLAFYSERLYLEEYQPDVSDVWWELRVGPVEDLNAPVDMAIYAYDPSLAVHQDIYAQYGHFIHSLRGQMGDEAFFRFLKDYYQTYRGKMAAGKDFRDMATRHSSSDLTPIFTQFLSRVDVSEK